MDNRHYEVKAIPTAYNGYRFRSRLEARLNDIAFALALEAA